MDFTLIAYKQFILTLRSQGYFCQTFEEYIQNPKEKVVILRHDVDRLPGNSLKTALLENELGIRATYFFRTIPGTLKPEIIKEIAGLGHEVSYHYEDLSLCRGDYELAIKNFEKNLNKLRKFYPVKTICMHGSPLSKWDNRDLWKRYDYRDYGIIAEPYFDLDFDEVLYLTDTGRRWDGDAFNIRDNVKSTEIRGQRSEVGKGQRSEIGGQKTKRRDGWMNRMAGWKKAGSKDLRFRSTWDIIEAAGRGLLPDKIMINTHPQRWTDNPVEWVKELVWQNFKNVIKKYFYVRK